MTVPFDSGLRSPELEITATSVWDEFHVSRIEVDDKFFTDPSLKLPQAVNCSGTPTKASVLGGSIQIAVTVGVAVEVMDDEGV
jgi:hypothetical protein